MTNAEAIRTLRLMQAQVEWDYPMDYDAAIDEAIKAMLKQIPQRPNYKAEDRYIKNHFIQISICPICHREIVAGDMYCIECGQRISWDE